MENSLKQPRFEDAFIDLLGGGPSSFGISRYRTANSTNPEETVIEARNLTKNLANLLAHLIP